MTETNKRRRQLRKIIATGLKETIKIHGPITRVLVGSATKRIAGLLTAKRTDRDRSKNDCKTEKDSDH